MIIVCPTCNGTGNPTELPGGIIISCECGRCPDCGGRGKVDEEKLKKEKEEFAKFLEKMRGEK
jgi:DnaJ-class molecular chaperone